MVWVYTTLKTAIAFFYTWQSLQNTTIFNRLFFFFFFFFGGGGGGGGVDLIFFITLGNDCKPNIDTPWNGFEVHIMYFNLKKES